MSGIMRKPVFAYAKTKAQINTFGFPTWIVQSLFKYQTSSHLLWLSTWFVSDLVENPKDRFSHDAAHMFSK